MKSLRDMAAALGRDLVPVKQAALAAAAGHIAEMVRAQLSMPPGGPHATPWAQSGRLRDSIGVSVDGDRATIGSTDPVAVFQEHGTRHMPPRPFLAPAAAAGAAEAAGGIGAAVAAALRAD